MIRFQSINIESAVDIVVSDPKPILMFDTCVLLDIIRFTHSSVSRCVSSSHKLINENKYHLIITELVLDEFKKNVDSVQDELIKIIKQMDEKHTEIFNAIPFLDMAPYPADKSILLQPLKIEERLRSIVEKIIDNAIHLKVNDDIEIRANRRAVNKIAPGKVGGSSADCQIIETYFEFVGLLRRRDFNKKIYFLTSNTDDFCGASKKTLHSELVNDFEERSLSFARGIIDISKDIDNGGKCPS